MSWLTLEPLSQTARALWYPSHGNRGPTETLSMTVREDIHALQRDIEPFMALIPSVNGGDIERRGKALCVGVCEFPTSAAVGRVP